jgi:sigma-B regulation protein RsbU (phosphoserine phosphatase)
VAGVDLGRQYLAATQVIKIGRKPENHICLKDPKVSRFHAILRFEDTFLKIVDLCSTNGTSVNGVKITMEQKLASGDQIRVGETLIKIIAEPW